MKWKTLKNFALSRDKNFLNRSLGVSLDEIEKVENDLSIKLPEGYIDFLLDCGRKTILASPFATGYGSTHDFSILTKTLRSLHYPHDKMFRIAMCDPTLQDSPLDLFVDVMQERSYDAMLLEYAPYGDFDPARLIKMNLSFMEFLSVQLIYHFFPDGKFSFSSLSKHEARTMLESEGFTPVLPGMQRVELYMKDGEFVKLEEECEEPDETSLSFYLNPNISLFARLKKYEI